jgi:DNA-binding CsgD family transcriptional regulator
VGSLPVALAWRREENLERPIEHVLKIAFDVAADRLACGRVTAPGAPPTRRERQVVALVAAGRTNWQIGRALGISAKTAEVHLSHVMAKLGARSRAEVAVWAVAHDGM